ncbi:MAG: O-antigen ligase family protein [Planctomycetota bacterium]|nr:O-antigen ligase family protein [Planctomycetota bacterium]
MIHPTDAKRAQEDFDHQNRAGSRGHASHTVCCALMAFGACLPPAYAEYGLALGAASFLAGLPRTYRTAWRPFLSPIGLCILAFVLWSLLSISWASDKNAAWNEWGKLRFAFVPFILWPSIDRRMTILAATLVGIACAQLAQLVHAAGVALNIPALTYPLAGNRVGWAIDELGAGDPDRNGGWWHPLIAGSMFLAACAIHLSAAMLSDVRDRALSGLRAHWPALAASGAALLAGVSVVATGSRGAILALSATILALFVARFALRRRGNRRTTLIVLAVTLVLGGGSLVTMGDRLARRFELARADVSRAIEEKNFTTDNGARLLMAWWAIEAVGERPVTGVGVGSYEAWTRAHVTRQGIDPASRRFFQHAHNALLHIAATTGLVGASLVLTLLAGSITFGVRIGLNATRQSRATAPARTVGASSTADSNALALLAHAYRFSPPAALASLAFVSVFDPVHYNTTTAFVLWLLIGLCPPWLPARRSTAATLADQDS